MRLYKICEHKGRMRIDAEGKQKSDEPLVFSNEVGEPLPHFHNAWLRTLLRAHDIKSRWTARLKYKGLSKESKNAFRKIDLRWHDLRHETPHAWSSAACRSRRS
jgi:hypothetical protein